MAFYLLDKVVGITSNKALGKLKHELNIKKAGFSGVLDPFASGLLIVATDGDTKFIERFLKSKKTYTGTILFGKRTDTLDIDGLIVRESEINLNEEQIRKVVNKNFIGSIVQIPPKFSNIKINGKRAHELTRKNVSFELKPVERFIYSFEVFNYDSDCIDFKVEVSSGTYIRSLAKDLGDLLNVPSMLTVLRREKIGEISVPKNNEFTKVSREELITIPSIHNPDEDEVKRLLDGKEVSLNKMGEEYIIYGQKIVLWIKRLKNTKYKIHKRIE